MECVDMGKYRRIETRMKIIMANIKCRERERERERDRERERERERE
jgi:hypothetical protein